MYKKDLKVLNFHSHFTGPSTMGWGEVRGEGGGEGREERRGREKKGEGRLENGNETTTAIVSI